MALSSFNTILIFGGTSGIGESFARRFHAMGKKVIITGRRQDRLILLSQDLPGLETYQLDNTDLVSLPKHVEELKAKFPTVDTVWVNSGTNTIANFKDFDSQTNDDIVNEINLNLTAPLILARHYIPHLLALEHESHFIVTGSGLAFVPTAMLPTYCATKAAIHSFMVSLRESVHGSNVRVIELAVPHVRTGFTNGIPGGMALEDFTEQMLALLSARPAAEVKEAGIAFGEVGASTWRNAFGPMLQKLGSSG